MSEFIERPFPPNLEAVWDKDFAVQLAAAQGALSGLNQAVSLLHNPALLMRPLLSKEAESSARLEGTQASVEDVYRSELVEDPEKKDDVAEIINYQEAMLEGVEAIRVNPLNQVTIRQIHKTLMAGVRGQTKAPGKYREGDVWIGALGTGQGQARYIPPNALHIPGLMEQLEVACSSKDVPPLVMAGLIHYQFEAIHPFKDGNGRTGRLLITLYLLKTEMLSAPMLYPSGYFEKNKDDYVEALHGVDTQENWYVWLMYFLKGLETQATLSLRVAREIDALFKDHRKKIEKQVAHLGLIRVLEYCFVQPYLTVSHLDTRLTDIPTNTLRRYLDVLEKSGVLVHIDTLKKGQKVYANVGLLAILRKI